jgi:hypothetical protein
MRSAPLSSISWKRSVNGQRPSVDAANQVRHPFETHPREIDSNLCATNAVMTNNYPFPVCVEFVQVRWHVGHRQVASTGEASEGNFLRLAHVKQVDLVATCQPAFELDGFDFANYRHSDRL